MNNKDREIEAKFYLQDKGKFETLLNAVGAGKVHERVLETNLRFDTPSGELERTKQVLRLRQDAKIRLTYKSSTKLEDGLFNRKEIEVEVGDFAAGRRLIEALGYQVAVIYEKFRTTYTLDGLEITVDELPYGNFVEIEGDEPDEIHACAARLELDWGAAVKNSYLGLFRIYRKKTKVKFRDLTFENFQGLKVSAEDLKVRPADTGSA